MLVHPRVSSITFWYPFIHLDRERHCENKVSHPSTQHNVPDSNPEFSTPPKEEWRPCSTKTKNQLMVSAWTVERSFILVKMLYLCVDGNNTKSTLLQRWSKHIRFGYYGRNCYWIFSLVKCIYCQLLYLWIPEHSMQSTIPQLVLAQVGSRNQQHEILNNMEKLNHAYNKVFSILKY